MMSTFRIILFLWITNVKERYLKLRRIEQKGNNDHGSRKD